MTALIFSVVTEQTIGLSLAQTVLSCTTTASRSASCLDCWSVLSTQSSEGLHLIAGYGNTYPNECWAAAWLIMVQSVLGMIMDAITIGIVFARISHPKQRGRTIAISDSAVISRRDGILKFMFRIADIRRTQVRHLPAVNGHHYTNCTSYLGEQSRTDNTHQHK